MWYVPYERLILKTNLRPEDALRRLAENVEPQRFWRWGWEKHKPYQGTIEGSQFTISRIIYRRNALLPLIRGEVQPDLEGSAIRLTLAPHVLGLVFMGLWLGLLGLALLGLLGAFVWASYQGSLAQPLLRGGLLSAACLLVFSYGILLLSFKFESVRSRTFFRDLFEARQVLELPAADAENASPSVTRTPTRD